MNKRAASGTLFGMAIGDALAAPTEFQPVDLIVRIHGPQGPASPSAKVTDDTQMALAVGEALLEAQTPWTASTLAEPLCRAFVSWFDSDDNNRAPGRTCLTACQNLAAGNPWLASTIPGSKGCGANMRVQPVGVAKIGGRPLAGPHRAAIAQFQAAITHGHATGLAASDLTAKAIAELAAGCTPHDLPALLQDYAHSQRMVYHEAWLSTLWQQPGMSSPQQFISRGWDECIAVLHRLVRALRHRDRTQDPCELTGDGWVAEDALGTGLLCFLWFADDAVAAVRRAAVTRGDSDSIACLTGAFAGASLGLGAWPATWLEHIEYRDRLARLAAAWD